MTASRPTGVEELQGVVFTVSCLDLTLQKSMTTDENNSGQLRYHYFRIYLLISELL